MSDSICQKLGGRTSLVVQWLRLPASTVGGMGSIPGRGTKILHAAWRSQKKAWGKIRRDISHHDWMPVF